MEGRLGWKRYPMVYEVRAEVGAVMGKEVVGAERAEELARQVTAARVRMMAAILKVLDAVGQRLQVIDRDSVAGLGARLLYRDGDEAQARAGARRS